MKTICKKLIVIILILNTSFSFGQTGKRNKAVFENTPATIHCDIALLEQSFNFIPGSYAEIKFHNNFRFAGKVLSNVKKYDNLQSVAIESVQYDNAILLISRQVNKDNSVTYTGRIMQRNSTDGYEIKVDAKGQYLLHKISTQQILQECL
jgi:hypothetical protein